MGRVVGEIPECRPGDMLPPFNAGPESVRDMIAGPNYPRPGPRVPVRVAGTGGAELAVWARK